MARGDVKGITIEITGKTSGLVKSLETANKAVTDVSKNLRAVNQALKLDPGNVEALTKKQELLNKAISATNERLKAETEAATQAKEALDLGKITQDQYDVFEAQILKTKASLKDLEGQAIETTDALNGVGEANVGGEASGSMQDLHDKTELVQKGLEAVVKVGDVAGEALARGFSLAADGARMAYDAIVKVADISADVTKQIGEWSYDLSSQVVEAYGNYEQLVGGVDKIFGSASSAVQRNARNAFQTATMSANDYMETITGFSASLLQGLGGDAQMAAEIADLALRDMSDNANTFGTDISSIISAYQGFAKGNYNMLDNLRIGYGGTKTELIRLINDSHILNEEISSLDDITFDQIIQAIHAVQTELNITGTTEREAATTIEGSINMLRASWQNLLTDLGRSDVDISEATQNVADSLVTVVNNIKPVLRRLSSNLPHVLPIILDTVKSEIPEAVRVAGMVMNAVGSSIADSAPDILDILIENLPEGASIVESLLTNLASALRSNSPKIVEAVNSVLPALVSVGAEIVSIIASSIIENAPAIGNAIMTAFGPVLDEIFGEGTSEKIQEVINKLIEKAPEILESFSSILDIIGNLIEYLPQIADVVIPLLEFASEHLPEIIGLLVSLKATGTLASIAIDAISVASAINSLSGAGGILGSIGAGASTAAGSLSAMAATAGPIAALVAEVAALGAEAYTLGQQIAEGEQLGLSWYETLAGGCAELIDDYTILGTVLDTDLSGALMRSQTQGEEAFEAIGTTAEYWIEQIDSAIESSGASATASVQDDCEKIRAAISALESLHPEIVIELKTHYSDTLSAGSAEVVTSSQREMANRYARQGRQQLAANSVSTAIGREMADRYRQQGEQALQAVQETARVAQQTISSAGSSGGGGGGGGGGGSSSKKDEESEVSGSKIKDILESIEDCFKKLLDRFGIVTEQTDYQKNVNQMIDGVLKAFEDGSTKNMGEEIGTAVNELRRTMDAFGMDSSVIDPTTLEQLRTLVNNPIQQGEQLSQMVGAVNQIGQVAIDYTPHFEMMEGYLNQLVILKQNEENVTNVYIGDEPVQALVVRAISDYNYETGGH